MEPNVAQLVIISKARLKLVIGCCDQLRRSFCVIYTAGFHHMLEARCWTREIEQSVWAATSHTGNVILTQPRNWHLLTTYDNLWHTNLTHPHHHLELPGQRCTHHLNSRILSNTTSPDMPLSDSQSTNVAYAWTLHLQLHLDTTHLFLIFFWFPLTLVRSILVPIAI